MAADASRTFQIYTEALEVNGEARRALVDARAGDDADLRAAVLDLLDSADQAEAQGFLDAPLAVKPTEAGIEQLSQRQFGPYQLLEPIGEGGFGTVFLARQTEPVVRRVALKLIRRDLCTDPVIERFRLEQQTLALLSHPNVAQVFDAGTGPQGDPYLVMEYIEGTPITEHCAARDLGFKARLELFIPVCDALQHAHQKGVIHRDIKPANVLVTEHHGRPLPKVIDFGIAKVLDLKVNEQTLATGTGFLGSPTYMSPEQIERSGLDIDIRSDVYGLGVLLHELLTGVPPFVADEQGMLALLNRILEEEPARPSRLAPSTSVIPTPEGDLDWIILKALSKDREQRYESAAALAADIRRFLRSEPVAARAPTVAYRARKFVQRYAVGVVASALVLMALVAGIVGTSAGFLSAREEAARARSAESLSRQQSEYAEQTVALLLEFLTSVDPGARGRELKVVELLDAYEGRLEALADRPQLQASLLDAYARTYHALGLYDQAVRFAEATVEAHRATLGEVDGRTLQARVQWSVSLREAGQYELAEKQGRAAMDRAAQALGGNHPATLAAALATADALVDLDRAAEAERLHRLVLAARQSSLGADHVETLFTMSRLARALWRQNKMEEAVALNRAVLDSRTRVLGEDHPDTLAAINELAVVVAIAGDLEEGEKLQRLAFEKRSEVLGPEHPKTLTALVNVAWVLREKGDYEQAERLTRQAWEIERRVQGDGHPGTLATQGNLAGALRSLGRLEEAETLLRDVLEKRESTLGRDHGATLVAINDLAGVLARQQKYELAHQMFSDLLERRLALSGREHVATVTTMSNLGWVLIRMGDYPGAVELLTDTSDLSRQVWGPLHPRTLNVFQRLADAQLQNQQPEAAELTYRTVLSGRQEVLGADNPHTLATLTSLALAIQAQGRVQEAESQLRRALAEQNRVLGREHDQTTRTRELLGELAAVPDPPR